MNAVIHKARTACVSAVKSIFNIAIAISQTTTCQTMDSNGLTTEEIAARSRCGLDSHADTSCAGNHVRILETIDGRSCDVYPFNESHYDPMKKVQLINGAFTSETIDGESIVVELNHALDFTKSMEHTLLCTNQARDNGVLIEDTPPQYSPSSVFGLQFPEEDIFLPLQEHGPTAYIPMRYPTDEELATCRHVELTNYDDWVPYRDTHNISDFQSVEWGKTPWDRYIDSLHINAINSTSPLILPRMVDKADTITEDSLSTMWGISLQAARQTLKSTTIQNRRTLHGDMHQRFRTRIHQCRYNQLGGYGGRFSSDTCFSKVKSLRGNTCAQLFINRRNYIGLYPMSSVSEAPDALNMFIHDVGVPNELHTDGAKELIGKKWTKICRKHNIKTTTSEPYSPWQNPAEKAVRQVKYRSRKMMRKTNTPIVLWDYAFQYTASLITRTATDMFSLEGVTPFESVHHYTPDISEFVYFPWYSWVWFHEPIAEDHQQLGRFCGPAHDTGQGLAYYILKDNGTVVIRSTVKPLSVEEKHVDTVQRRMEIHDIGIQNTIGNHAKATVKGEALDVGRGLLQPLNYEINTEE